MIKIRRRLWDQRAASGGYAVAAVEAFKELVAQAFEVEVIDGGDTPGATFYTDDDIERRAAQALADKRVEAPPKRKPGRPRTGVTPLKERKRKSAEALLKAGGRRLDIRLQPQGAADLEEVHKDHPGLDDSAAVHLALRWYASRRSRKPRE